MKPGGPLLSSSQSSPQFSILSPLSRSADSPASELGGTTYFSTSPAHFDCNFSESPTFHIYYPLWRISTPFLSPSPSLYGVTYPNRPHSAPPASIHHSPCTPPIASRERTVASPKSTTIRHVLPISAPSNPAVLDVQTQLLSLSRSRLGAVDQIPINQRSTHFTCAPQSISYVPHRLRRRYCQRLNHGRADSHRIPPKPVYSYNESSSSVSDFSCDKNHGYKGWNSSLEGSIQTAVDGTASDFLRSEDSRCVPPVSSEQLVSKEDNISSPSQGERISDSYEAQSQSSSLYLSSLCLDNLSPDDFENGALAESSYDDSDDRLSYELSEGALYEHMIQPKSAVEPNVEHKVLNLSVKEDEISKTEVSIRVTAPLPHADHISSLLALAHSTRIPAEKTLKALGVFAPPLERILRRFPLGSAIHNPASPNGRLHASYILDRIVNWGAHGVVFRANVVLHVPPSSSTSYSPTALHSPGVSTPRASAYKSRNNSRPDTVLSPAQRKAVMQSMRMPETHTITVDTEPTAETQSTEAKHFKTDTDQTKKRLGPFAGLVRLFHPLRKSTDASASPTTYSPEKPNNSAESQDPSLNMKREVESAKSRDINTNTHVAVKIVNVDHVEVNVERDELERVCLEATLLSQVDHPSIAQ